MTEPRWLTIARSLVGTRETPGVANSPVIIAWAKRLSVKVLGALYSQDATPWCGLFVAHCMAEAGLTPPPLALRATSWSTWGSALIFSRAAPGAVLVFVRPGGGHVGFYLGEDVTHFHVLGGNQGDCVSIARIEKSRCIACRWPSLVPVIGAPVKMLASASPISGGEA